MWTPQSFSHFESFLVRLAIALTGLRLSYSATSWPVVRIFFLPACGYLFGVSGTLGGFLGGFCKGAKIEPSGVVVLPIFFFVTFLEVVWFITKCGEGCGDGGGAGAAGAS